MLLSANNRLSMQIRGYRKVFGAQDCDSSVLACLSEDERIRLPLVTWLKRLSVLEDAQLLWGLQNG
jgi:hypothetical protein